MLLMGQSAISITLFNSKLFGYRRVTCVANRLLARVYKLVNVLGLLWEDCQQCIPHLGSIAALHCYPGRTNVMVNSPPKR